MVKKITWNWSPACMETNGERIDAYSDSYEEAVVGIKGVIRINEINVKDSKPYYEVKKKDGSSILVFNPNTCVKIKQS